MADYQHSRDYPPNHLRTGEGGTGLFWLLATIAVLGIIVLFSAFGGGTTSVEHPGGAGVDPVVTPTEPAPLPDTGTTIVD